MDWVRQDGAVAGCSEHVTKLHVIIEVHTYWLAERPGWGSCPVVGFGISGVETSGSATRELVN
jgi:hypothetical protein